VVANVLAGSAGQSHAVPAGSPSNAGTSVSAGVVGGAAAERAPARREIMPSIELRSTVSLSGQLHQCMCGDNAGPTLTWQTGVG
jgi:hypothetical protein